MNTKLRLNVEVVQEMVNLFKFTKRFLKKNHISLSKYKNRHNKHVNSMNIDLIEESKEIHLN